MASPGDSGVSKSSLYSRATYIEGESPHLPRDMDHSLVIAREEVCAHPLHDATPQYIDYILWGENLSVFISHCIKKSLKLKSVK